MISNIISDIDIWKSLCEIFYYLLVSAFKNEEQKNNTIHANLQTFTAFSSKNNILDFQKFIILFTNLLCIFSIYYHVKYAELVGTFI